MISKSKVEYNMKRLKDLTVSKDANSENWTDEDIIETIKAIRNV